MKTVKRNAVYLTDAELRIVKEAMREFEAGYWDLNRASYREEAILASAYFACLNPAKVKLPKDDITNH